MKRSENRYACKKCIGGLKFTCVTIICISREKVKRWCKFVAEEWFFFLLRPPLPTITVARPEVSKKYGLLRKYCFNKVPDPSSVANDGGMYTQ
jgi:hypothetical protein